MLVFYSNLPAKPAEEAQKHRQQYEEMVAQAKKRGDRLYPLLFLTSPFCFPLVFAFNPLRSTELKEAQRRKKQLEDRCKLEESIGTAAQTWNQEILPNWSTM